MNALLDRCSVFPFSCLFRFLVAHFEPSKYMASLESKKLVANIAILVFAFVEASNAMAITSAKYFLKPERQRKTRF